MLDVALLRHLQPLAGLSEPRLQELLAHCERETYALGSDPLKVPHGADQFLYLIEGELRVVYADGSSSVLVGGCDVANWPLGHKTAPPASSKAITEIVLLRVDFELLGMMTWDGGAGTESAATQEPAAGSGFNTIVSSPLQRLLPANFVDFADRFERYPVRKGDIVIREGDPGEHYFLIEAGRCEIFRQVGRVKVPLAELVAGQAFGEESLVTDEPRNASVQMLSDGVLLRMRKADFVRLIKEPLLHAIQWSAASAQVACGQARWLDARYPAEFSQNGLSDALNVPLSEIRTAFNFLDRDTAYIVYCDNGRRSSAAAFLLARQGFNAFWLTGGLASVPADPAVHI